MPCGGRNQEDDIMIRIRLRWLGVVAAAGGIVAVGWLCSAPPGVVAPERETLEERLQRESNVIPTCEPEDGVARVPYRVSDAAAVALPPEIDVHNPPVFSRLLFSPGTDGESTGAVAAP